MAEIPDFENISALTQWVEKLKPEEIQSWSTKDWNKMYEKLDNVILSSPEINAKQKEFLTQNDFNETFQKIYFNSTKDNDPHNLYEHKAKRARRIFKTEYGEKIFPKLYSNYRLEKQDYDKLVAHGKEIGTKLAQMNTPNTPVKPIDNARAHIYSKSNIDQKKRTATLSDKAVFETTTLGEYNFSPETGLPLKPYEEVKSQIEIKEITSNGYNEIIKNNPNQTKTTIDIREKDAVLGTAIHEAVHAQAQVKTKYQLQNKEEKLLPRENMSEDFYTLIQNNRNYYFSYDTPSGNTTRQERKTNYQGYAKQPIEKHAELVAVVAERTFRKEKEQYSERAANDLSILIPTLPETAFYAPKNSDIFIAYNKEDLKKDGATKDTFKDKFLPDLDEKTKNKIQIIEEGNFVYVSVPKDYESRLALEKCKNKRLDEQIAKNKNKAPAQTEKAAPNQPQKEESATLKKTSTLSPMQLSNLQNSR